MARAWAGLLMTTMRIPTTHRTATVDVVDHFDMAIHGQTFTFAVHTHPQHGGPLTVAEFTTGRHVATLALIYPSDYRRAQARLAIVEARDTMGSDVLHMRLLATIGEAARLNTPHQHAQAVGHG